MSVGLLALLDDVAALIKVTAASLDDIPAQVAKTTTKVSGVVIDDAAVTPKYVVGLDPKRELAIIYRIARSSLINKILFLAPGALLLGFLAPWAIQPILMVGGAFLCYEGYEKVHSLLSHHEAEELGSEPVEAITPEVLEKMRIKSAVNTDFILSGEIIAITYASVATKDLATQIVVLLSIAIGITVAVYGFVGMIVKADDVGVYMAKHSRFAAIRSLGVGIVKFMPHFLVVLSYIGTAAMLWVGAEIISHGIPMLHHALEALQSSMSFSPTLAWFNKAGSCALGGLVLGALIDRALRILKRLRDKDTPKIHY